MTTEVSSASPLDISVMPAGSFDEWMIEQNPKHCPTDDTVALRMLRKCWKDAQARYSEWPSAWELWVSRPDRNQGWVRYNVYETHNLAKNALKRVEGPPLELKIVGLYAKQA